MTIYLTLHSQYTEAIAISGVISTELGTIIGYYFGTRNRSEQKNDEKEEQRKIFLAESNFIRQI